MNADAQARLGYTLPTDPDTKQLSPDAERMWFELDRDLVLNQIDSLHDTIEQNSGELAMVAHEGVFGKGLSDKLSRAAHSLRILSQELAGLRGQVAKTNGYPTNHRTKR
jgi:hypothetical protein